MATGARVGPTPHCSGRRRAGVRRAGAGPKDQISFVLNFLYFWNFISTMDTDLEIFNITKKLSFETKLGHELAIIDYRWKKAK